MNEAAHVHRIKHFIDQFVISNLAPPSKQRYVELLRSAHARLSSGRQYKYDRGESRLIL